MDKIRILKRLKIPLLKSLSTDELKLYLLFIVCAELDLNTIKRSLGNDYDIKQLKESLQRFEKMGLGKINRGRNGYEFHIDSR